MYVTLLLLPCPPLPPPIPAFFLPPFACCPPSPMQVSEGNIRTLARELLDYLDVCDTEFKPDLANKVTTLFLVVTLNIDLQMPVVKMGLLNQSVDQSISRVIAET